MPDTAERNLIDVPLYTPVDVARYLRAPVWLVLCARRGWFLPHPEMFCRWFGEGRDLVGMSDDLPDIPDLQERWSFRQAADLYVRSFAVETLLSLAREEETSRSTVLRDAAWAVFRSHLRVPMFFNKEGSNEGSLTHLPSACAASLTDGERGLLEKKLHLCLGRFDLDGNEPQRLYPFSRVPVEDSPRVVVMDPSIRFGRPTVAGHGTPVDILLERYQAGDSLADLADDYGLSTQEVEEVLRYESKPVPLFFPLECC